MTDDRVGLVLAGGGARGAYEIGVLGEMLPVLEERGERPRVLVGTSVGALNAAHLASTAHLPAREAVAQARRAWSEITYPAVLRPLASVGELRRLAGLVGGMVGLRPGVPVSLLDAAPLQRTVQRLIDFDQLARNAASSVLSAVGLVATSYETSRSVVFHAGGQTPADDRTRAIHYAPASLTPAHVLASAAIPVAFPPVRVEEPAEAAGWYCDGGTRLNTPIKPVLSLGADRVVVVGLNSVASPPAAGYPQDGTTPDLFDGAVQYLQALLADPLAHDVATLASTNEAVAAGRAAGGSPRRGRRIPYMFIAPSDRYGLGALAAEVYQQYYAGLSGLRRSADLALLGRVIDPGRGPVRGELFSYLFFAPEYLEAALELGSRDAQRWLAATQDDGPWRHEHQERPTTE